MFEVYAHLERGQEAGGWTYRGGALRPRPSIGDDVKTTARLGDVAAVSLDSTRATRTSRWDELSACRDSIEALAAELGADDFGYEYALPR